MSRSPLDKTFPITHLIKHKRFSAGEDGGKLITFSLFSLEKVSARSFMLGGDMDATHNGADQCPVPQWSANTVVTEEVVLRD